MVMRGERDLALSQVTITPRPAFIINARLAPDSERFLLTTTMVDLGRTNLVFLDYQLQADSSWVGTTGYTLGQIASSISTPSAGPDRRAVFGGQGNALYEIGDDGTGAGWGGRKDHVLAAVMP
jgi:hypothetical protein